jgi:hypothetical protein
MEEQEADAIVGVEHVVVVGRKRKRLPYEQRLPMYIVRDQRRIMSTLQESHDEYIGHFQHQPYSEEFAVCLLIAYGHIIGRQQSIKPNTKDRSVFQVTADQLQVKQPSVKGGFSNPRGHYHFQVLKIVLDKKQNKKPVKISLGVSSSVENNVQRSQDLIAAIANTVGETFLFRATIVLTERGNVAEGHYVVVKKVTGHVPVVLDGLFDGPKKLTVDSLVRYTQIEKLFVILEK